MFSVSVKVVGAERPPFQDICAIDVSIFRFHGPLVTSVADFQVTYLTFSTH